MNTPSVWMHCGVVCLYLYVSLWANEPILRVCFPRTPHGHPSRGRVTIESNPSTTNEENEDGTSSGESRLSQISRCETMMCVCLISSEKTSQLTPRGQSMIGQRAQSVFESSSTAHMGFHSHHPSSQAITTDVWAALRRLLGTATTNKTNTQGSSR